MKPAKILLCKLFGLSLLLFLVWRPVASVYGILLQAYFVDAYGMAAPINDNWPYVASLFLIPLVSLVCFTPGLGWAGKVGAILAGGLASLVLDVLKIRFGIGDDGQLLAIYSIYHSLKWLLPLLIWLLVSQRQLAAFFRSEPVSEKYSCPLCGDWTEYPVQHISIAHGTRSLRYKKVRKFLVRNQPLSGSPF